MRPTQHPARAHRAPSAHPHCSSAQCPSGPQAPALCTHGALSVAPGQRVHPVVAVKLGIPLENIFANQLLFGSNGEFLGFETSEPSYFQESGGKAKAVEHIRKHRGYKAMIMVGDGATDLEARKPGGADLFICYGGVQLRESVATKADWLVFNFQDLLNSLE
ncbi:hypothetical protein J5N97_028614 [Dioscorea zingiberensis]|uniref:phosphoserine phosphatase n=1 Tax=Dioscorea zingiberensis TaxID=325984 RepID=A0A9D5BZS5_9LILI|nr:hypothetical protein J5N97_028614 [Dioscorea zingiberensis]